MNALEAKVIKGILGSMICLSVAGFIIETQIVSLDLRIRKLENAKEDAE